MDLSGNVFIAHRSFYVERIGFPNKYPEKRQRRYPFSDKASLILRELLKGPKRQWGIRELAEKIGLDPGYVSRMAKSLSESGYAARTGGKLKIRSAKEILDDWVRAYDLKRNEHHRFFMLAPDVKSILQRLRKIDVTQKVEYALSVKRSLPDRKRFFEIARGSALECAAVLDQLQIMRVFTPTLHKKDGEKPNRS